MSEPSTVDVDELRRQLRALAPEALAGDPDALRELDVIEGRLVEEERRLELAELAAQEQEDRDRRAADAEAERQRAEMRAEQEAAEAECDKALLVFETALTKALAAAAAALEQNDIVTRTSHALDPKSGGRKLNREVESRILRRVRQELHPWNIRPDVLWALEGMEPLVAMSTARCSICTHPELEAIEASLVAGDTLVAVAERFGTTKSSLSRHRRHVHP